MRNPYRKWKNNNCWNMKCIRKRKQCHFLIGCVKLNGCQSKRVKFGRRCQPQKLYRNAKCKITKCVGCIGNVVNWKQSHSALHFDISRFPKGCEKSKGCETSSKERSVEGVRKIKKVLILQWVWEKKNKYVVGMKVYNKRCTRPGTSVRLRSPSVPCGWTLRSVA